MSDAPEKESPPTPEPETAKPPDQPAPFQFSIAGLMILTAAVAGFFALLTQAPRPITVICVYFFLLVVGMWMWPKYRRGIFVLGLFFLVFMLIGGSWDWLTPRAVSFFEASLLAILASSIYACFSSNRFDKITGIFVISCLLLLIINALFYQIMR